MIRHALLPPVVMGALMGLMLPVVLHADMGGSLAFLAAHVAVAAVLLALFSCLPRLRPWIRSVARHRPRAAHLPLLVAGLAAGWGAVCLYCLSIDGRHF